MAASKLIQPVINEITASPDQYSEEHIDQAVRLMSEQLSPKRVKFVNNYVANGFNGSAAYRAAGYKSTRKTAANTESSKILANAKVGAYLMWKLRELMAKEDTVIDEGRLIRESNALAYSSLTDVVSWDAEGKITVKPSSEIPREVAVAVKKFKCTTKTMTSEGGPDIETTTIEIEMHDKKGAIDLQARISGLLRDEKIADHSNYTLNMYFGEPPKPKEKDVGPH